MTVLQLRERRCGADVTGRRMSALARWGRVPAFAIAILAVTVSLSGCGEDRRSGVRFQGNVVDVIVPENDQAKTPGGFFSRFASLGAFLFPAAVAQQGSCDADAARVLACAATGRGANCDDSAVQCVRIDPSTCEFSVEVRVTCVELSGLFFVLDANENGRFETNEKQAGLGFECSSEEPEKCIVRTCNGDRIRARDVSIEFFAEPIEETDGTAEAEEIVKTRDTCPSPTTTPTPEPTPTPTSLLPI